MKKTLFVFLLSLLALISLSACQTAVPYHRSLPDWVRRIYVPMAENKTTDAGLEALATSAFTEAVLADGRLEVVSKSKADAVVKITLDKAEKESSTFTTDDVEETRALILTYSIDLYDPVDMEKPFAHLSRAQVTTSYSSDLRSLSGVPSAQGRAVWAKTAGKTMLADVLFKLNSGADGNADKDRKEKDKKKKKL
jgi:hypothetical protein